MPLANIVESGDNYIRFSNGIQICYGYELWTIKRMTKDRRALSVDYTKPFCDFPTCSVFRQLRINGDDDTFKENYRIDMIETTYERATYYLVNIKGSAIENGTYGLGYFAIGKWK